MQSEVVLYIKQQFFQTKITLKLNISRFTGDDSLVKVATELPLKRT